MTTLRIILSIIALTTSALTRAPHARADESVIVRTYGAGSDFYGDLSDHRAAKTFGLGIRRGADGFSMRFDILNLALPDSSGVFPFAPSEDLTFLAFLLQPAWCAPLAANLSGCAGLGVGIVNVNGRDDKQDYGTWHYDATLSYLLTPSWSIEAVVKYVGRVEQTNAGKKSDFSMLTYGLGPSLAL